MVKKYQMLIEVRLVFLKKQHKTPCEVVLDFKTHRPKTRRYFALMCCICETIVEASQTPANAKHVEDHIYSIYNCKIITDLRIQ